MTSPSRIGLGLIPEIHNRLNELTKKFDITQSRLVEALLLMDDDLIAQQIEASKEKSAELRNQRKEAKRDLARELKKLSAKDLEKLMEKMNGK